MSDKLYDAFSLKFSSRILMYCPVTVIIHEIQTTFDNNPIADVRGVFLDISKAFDKVWHDGLRVNYSGYSKTKLISGKCSLIPVPINQRVVSFSPVN